MEADSIIDGNINKFYRIRKLTSFYMSCEIV